MTKENRPHEEGGTRSGGPADDSTALVRQVSVDGRFVLVPSLEYVELMIDAGQWRLLRESPHVAELLGEWTEWDRRRQLRESSHDIAATPRAPWHSLTYAAIERRRDERTIPEWAKAANAALEHARGAA